MSLSFTTTLPTQHRFKGDPSFIMTFALRDLRARLNLWSLFGGGKSEIFMPQHRRLFMSTEIVPKVCPVGCVIPPLAAGLSS